MLLVYCHLKDISGNAALELQNCYEADETFHYQTLIEGKNLKFQKGTRSKYGGGRAGGGEGGGGGFHQGYLQVLTPSQKIPRNTS